MEAARGEHDTVIVFLHWGVEKETCPVARQLDLADRLCHITGLIAHGIFPGTLVAEVLVARADGSIDVLTH